MLDWVRDLFRGIYQVFVPRRKLRHALGEVYPLDWLADHPVTGSEWKLSDDLGDLMCGEPTDSRR